MAPSLHYLRGVEGTRPTRPARPTVPSFPVHAVFQHLIVWCGPALGPTFFFLSKDVVHAKRPATTCAVPFHALPRPFLVCSRCALGRTQFWRCYPVTRKRALPRSFAPAANRGRRHCHAAHRSLPPASQRLPGPSLLAGPAVPHRLPLRQLA